LRFKISAHLRQRTDLPLFDDEFGRVAGEIEVIGFGGGVTGAQEEFLDRARGVVLCFSQGVVDDLRHWLASPPEEENDGDQCGKG
jgi:hypothetical protein